MKPVSFFILLFGVWCCKQAGENTRHMPTGDRSWHSEKVSAKDSSQYAPFFLEQLAKADYPDSILLDGPRLIVSGDTTLFPLFPKIGDTANFNIAGFKLKISRINYSSISYLAQWESPANNWVTRTGEANLNPLFFLAAEVAEDPETGATLGMAAFGNEANDYAISILVSLDTASNGKLMSAFSLIPKSPASGTSVSSPILNQN